MRNMSIAKGKVSIFSRTGGALCLLLIAAACFGQDNGQGAEPRYAPGVLIVKFKEEAADILKAALVKGEPLHQVSISPSLDSLALKYGLKGMRMLFPSFQVKDADGRVTRIESMEEHVAKVREKFPVRAARAPADYRGPDLTLWFRLDLDTSADIESAASEYRCIPSVQDAHPNYLGEFLWVPNDPYYRGPGWQGPPYEDLWGIKRIRCAEAWDTTRGSGTIVAVLDTGIWYRRVSGYYEQYNGHPDMVQNLWVNWPEYYGRRGCDEDQNGYVDDVWGWNFFDPDERTDPLDHIGHGT